MKQMIDLIIDIFAVFELALMVTKINLQEIMIGLICLKIHRKTRVLKNTKKVWQHSFKSPSAGDDSFKRRNKSQSRADILYLAFKHPIKI
jgi:hypothetical protein